MVPYSGLIYGLWHFFSSLYKRIDFGEYNATKSSNNYLFNFLFNLLPQHNKVHILKFTFSILQRPYIYIYIYIFNVTS